MAVSDDDLKFCDPWESQDFTKEMELTPDGHCDHCLPDCISTIYDTRLSSAPFGRCDHKNVGSSPMCQLSVNPTINPPIWASDVNLEYGDSPPEFFKNAGIFPNKRRKIQENKMDDLVLKKDVENEPFYDAYEQDIAVVNFYFDKSSILQFSRQQRLTVVDYISQMGGLLGLFIGFSFISAVELIYWLTLRMARNARNDRRYKNKTNGLEKKKSNTKMVWSQKTDLDEKL